MAKKKALISGITGQDGSYLAELLLAKGYEVHGVIRRCSLFNTSRIDHLFAPDCRNYLHFGDLAQGLDNLIYTIKPDEIYNLAAMSQVRVSFDVPVYTADINAVGVVRILEAIKRGVAAGILDPKIKYYQASSSEMFGQTPTPQGGYDESSIFTPVSPYGVAKLYGYFITRTYRTGYNLFACNGILFNHESSRRGPTFVTRKITHTACKIALGLQDKLYLGNLDAKRDWGHSQDYMEAIYAIMQAPQAEDWIVATGEQHTVKEFVQEVFTYLGLDWTKHVEYEQSLTRPNEVPNLLGNATKIKTQLGWTPKYNFHELVKEMVDADMELLKNGKD